VFGRLAGYEDGSDAERLCRDPAMRWVVGDRAITGSAASASQMRRFETRWLSRPENLTALADLPGRWIDTVHRRRSPKRIVLDMDSNESPIHGERKAAPTTAISAHVERCAPAAGQRAQCRRLARGASSATGTSVLSRK
jgi:hypothetical protein